ncbi:hypothetical protein, partial [Paenibacillus polymyxa]|uniref:hypothetical protein n=1 Tax=Paenibacillus polymyxa TaxID=1406 RepID=UPI0006BFE823
ASRILVNSKNEGKKLARSTLMRYVKAYRDGMKQGVPMALECFVKATDINYIQRKDTIAIEICSPRHPEVVVDVVYTKYADEYHSIIKETIEKDYLNTRRLKASAIFRIMEAKCTKSEKWFETDSRNYSSFSLKTVKSKDGCNF